VKDLAGVYSFSSTQNEIYVFNQNLAEAMKAIEENAAKDLGGQHSTAFGLKKDGSLLFWSSKDKRPTAFGDPKALKNLLDAKVPEGKITFSQGGSTYFGVYKYSDKWGAYLVRAEEQSEFNEQTRAIFVRVSIIILIMTAVCLAVGAFLVHYILRFVARMTQSIMKMQSGQKMGLIDLVGAPNDDVTYLGASFNSLSSTIDNLMSIFRRFVTKDIAQRAYSEREVRLEGTTRQLTILFSDIKGFTFMTETLGTDIIDVLNLHYQRAIKKIHDQNGIVGSIIGDALLAVFGTLETGANKAHEALQAAYLIQDVAAELRQDIAVQREQIVRRRGALTDAEERVYRAVLLEVGVGIDGGEVFYGNIGSYERMTNTVIGDNVNSASRLEGLTRIYRVPVVVSEAIYREVEGCCGGYRFVELDKVQVKGKTEGKRIFWPVRSEFVDDALEQEFKTFEAGLAEYYAGDWQKATAIWKPVKLPLVEIFRDRIAGGTAPENWNGIWAMTTK
jgi:class 3 adenylate cyclase